MKEKLIPFDKMSKKKQREMNKKKRGNWGNVHPSTKPFESNYKRRKDELKGVE